MQKVLQVGSKEMIKKNSTGFAGAIYNFQRIILVVINNQFVRFSPFQPDLHFISNNIHGRNKK
jgi:hypothetical protein